MKIDISVKREGRLLNKGKLLHWVNNTVPKLTEYQARRGRVYAANIAPKDSGALIQSIKDEPYGNKGAWMVVSRVPKNIKKNNPRNVPYHEYLEHGRSVKVKGGKTQRYMKATGIWLSEKYPELIKQDLKNTIRK